VPGWYCVQTWAGSVQNGCDELLHVLTSCTYIGDYTTWEFWRFGECYQSFGWQMQTTDYVTHATQEECEAACGN